jgi:hypothetical protein
MEKSGCPITTVSGAGQTAPFSGGILNVADANTFPTLGTVQIDGVGIVTYTGKSSTTLTGCTGGSGTATDGGSVYSGYENIGITSGCIGWVMSGNVLLNSRDNGISASAARTVITGNVIDGALYHGVLLSGSDSVVTGNLVRNVGSATGTYAGVNVNATTNCIVVGNRIVDDRGPSNLMVYGVREFTSAGGHRYYANRIVGATSLSYLLVSGSSSALDQIGAVTQPYSASISPDSSTVKKTIVVTNTSAFTINATSNPFPGAAIIFDIKNSSGAAMGTITWNAIYKLAGSFTNPADTKRRTISFVYDGTDWVETGRSASDI